MTMNVEGFRDVLREALNPEKVKTCKKINCSEVTVKENGNKMILSYEMLDTNQLVEMEYIDGLLNRIYKDGQIDFDYNTER